MEHDPSCTEIKLQFVTKKADAKIMLCSRLHQPRCPQPPIGYHPSLLLLHRRRDAVRWTIRMRAQITGGTFFWLNDTADGEMSSTYRKALELLQKEFKHSALLFGAMGALPVYGAAAVVGGVGMGLLTAIAGGLKTLKHKQTLDKYAPLVSL